MPAEPPNSSGEPSPGPRPNRFARYRLAFLLPLPFLIALAVDFGAGALLLERHIRLPNGFYHHGLVPMRSNIETWGHQPAQYYTNSLGMRDVSQREVPLEGDRHRILVLGDSFAEGVGLEYAKTVPGRLAAARPDLEVLNAAVVSHSPRLEYLRLVHLAEVVGLDFDEVVVFIDISDVQDEFLYGRFVPKPIPSGAWLRYRVRSFLRQWSYLGFTLLSARADGRAAHFDEGVFPELQENYRRTRSERFWKRRGSWPSLEAPLPKWVEAGRAGLLANLGNIVDHCEAAGRPLHFVAYPWPQQLGPEGLSGVHIDPIRELAAARGVPLVDLYPVFEAAGSPGHVRNRYFFRGDVHWNEAGSRLVADAVLERLAPPARP